jgi:hypothetical protein
MRVRFKPRQAAGAEHCRHQPTSIFIATLKIEPHIAEQTAGNAWKVFPLGHLDG